MTIRIIISRIDHYHHNTKPKIPATKLNIQETSLMDDELAVIYRDDEDEGEDFLVEVVVRVVVVVPRIVTICTPDVVVVLEGELGLSSAEVDRLDVAPARLSDVDVDVSTTS
jgi:hypothetical protein